MANRIIITDEDTTGDNIVLVTRRALPQTIAGLAAGTWYVLNTAMSGPVTVAGLPGQLRLASTNASRSIHSGHSLTDAYVQTGPWPGSLRILAEDQGLASGADRLIKSTIPGSPISYRWSHQIANNVGANEADARVDVSDFQTLVITEAGPPPHVNNIGDMTHTLDYLCRFVDNHIENGDGEDIILWSIWPALQGPGANAAGNPIPADWQGYTFRTGLEEYTRSFKYMADYVTWKMHQEFPVIDQGFRVWIIPGSEWMIRVYDDIQLGLVPGITDISQLFDTVNDHPDEIIHTNAVGGYGLAVFVLTSMYHHQFLQEDDPWIAPSVSEPLAQYFWQVAHDIAQTYEPVGMGGTNGGALEFDGSVDADPLADSEEPEPGDPVLPTGAFEWTAAANTFPALTRTGSAPVPGDGYFMLDLVAEDNHRMAFDISDFHFVAAIRTPERPPGSILHLVRAGNGIWSYPSTTCRLNWHFNPGSLSASHIPVGGTWENEVIVSAADVDTTDWTIIAISASGNTLTAYNAADGAAVSLPLVDELPQVSQVYLLAAESAVNQLQVAGMALLPRAPTGGEIADMRAWAQARIIAAEA